MAIGASVAVSGCLDQFTEESKEEFKNIPDSCSASDDMFQMSLVNNTDTDRDVGFSLFHNDTEFLFQQVNLGPENGDNGETIRGISCFGERYRIEVDAEGYQTNEQSFFAEEGGFLTIVINPGESRIVYTLGD